MFFSGNGQPARDHRGAHQSGDVEAEASASWVKVSDVTATSFTIEVVDNDTNEIREAEITVTAGQAEEVIKVMQMVGDHSFPRYRPDRKFFKIWRLCRRTESMSAVSIMVRTNRARPYSIP